jgi:hypothetical protein
MPGVDHRSPNFIQAQLQSATRAEARAANEPTIRQSSSSLAAKKIVQANTEKKVEQNIETKEAIDSLLTKKADQEKTNHEIKKQRSVQADAFHKNDSTNTTKQNSSISQFAAEVQDKKQRQQETQRLAQNINNAQIGQARAKVNNPQARAASDEAQASALVAQANVDSIDPDSLSKEEKQANKFLQEIFDRGGEKGKGFVSFARREISKGRLAEIMDLIEGYHKTLKGNSQTASEMVESGEERLLTVKNMISPTNVEELQILNQKIVSRPDAPVGFKRDQMLIRNLSGAQRVAPPSFNKAAKPTKVEEVIRFVSTINNSVLTAPWDRVA